MRASDLSLCVVVMTWAAACSSDTAGASRSGGRGSSVSGGLGGSTASPGGGAFGNGPSGGGAKTSGGGASGTTAAPMLEPIDPNAPVFKQDDTAMAGLDPAT